MAETDLASRTRFFGPQSLPPTHEDVSTFLLELDHWNATAPHDFPSSYPRQDQETKRGFYLQTMLLLMRPVLRQDVVDPDMLLLCAEKAAEACEVCFSPTCWVHGPVTDQLQDCKTLDSQPSDTSGFGGLVPMLSQWCDLSRMSRFTADHFVVTADGAGNCRLHQRPGRLLTLLPNGSSIPGAL